MSLGSVPRSYFLRSLHLFLLKSFKTVFLLRSKEPLFSTFLRTGSTGSVLPLSVLCVVFADNFCEHNCLVQFCCKLTHHKMHC